MSPLHRPYCCYPHPLPWNHFTSRSHKEIITKYPEIQKLYGSDWRPAPFAVALIVGQLALAYHSKAWSNTFFFLVAWIYGGAAAHALSLMTHELSHNLVFSSPKANEYFGIICNIGMGVPSSTMFKRYHMEHHLYVSVHLASRICVVFASAFASEYFPLTNPRSHLHPHPTPPHTLPHCRYQGDLEKDTDIPTSWEGRFFTNTFLKAIWLFCQPLFYAMRPSFVRVTCHLFHVCLCPSTSIACP